MQVQPFGTLGVMLIQCPKLEIGHFVEVGVWGYIRGFLFDLVIFSSMPRFSLWKGYASYHWTW